jgi:hypothetical protein
MLRLQKVSTVQVCKVKQGAMLTTLKEARVLLQDWLIARSIRTTAGFQ